MAIYNNNNYDFQTSISTWLPAFRPSKIVEAEDGRSRSEASGWQDAWETARGAEEMEREERTSEKCDSGEGPAGVP